MIYFLLLLVFVWLGMTALFHWIYREGWIKAFTEVSIGLTVLAVVIWLIYMGLVTWE